MDSNTVEERRWRRKRLMVCPCCGKPVRMYLTARDDSRVFVGPFHVTNICSICGKDFNESLESTVMHHERYDNDNPLAYTKEICNRCHSKITATEQRVNLNEAVRMAILGAKGIISYRSKRASWTYDLR